jgi:FlaA1/EpsC-like NDP-sugar epimerase
MMSVDFRNDVLIPLIRVADLVLVCGSFLSSLAISSGSLTWPGFAEVLVMRIKVANLILFLGYLALCSAMFSACGLYRSHRLSRVKQRLYEIVLAVTLITGALLALKGLFLLAFATTKFFLWFWPLTLSIVMLSHETALELLHRARLRGRNLRNVIIVGEGPDALALADHVSQDASLGYRILRIIDARGITEDGYIAGDR